ncbi:hypothetical protein [Fusibacter sp. JL216-2]|uniref:hypothetical protein n=1 Tax=Fusibacter sp. JL216-2 TaxID=3071453 RepID=UPI003D346EB5
MNRVKLIISIVALLSSIYALRTGSYTIIALIASLVCAIEFFQCILPSEKKLFNAVLFLCASITSFAVFIKMLS